MKKIFKTIVSIVVVVAILSGGFWVYRTFFDESKNDQSVIDILNGKLENIAEFNTAEYVCTIVKQETNSKKVKDWKVPLTTKSFIISYDGVVKAGIKDMNAVTITKKDDSTILVSIPKMEITNSYLDLDTYKAYDQSNNPLNMITTDDITEAQSTMVKEMEQKALKKGLLDTALKNAKTMLTSMLKCAEIENYTIDFEVQK